MEIVSNAPLRTASLIWQPQIGTFALTVICKATYWLVPGVAELAAEQENPNDEDNYWNDDPTRSLYAPSDLVPYKTRADVVLVGYAFTPRGEPAHAVVTRLLVGTVDKEIEVHADRSWTDSGSLREGPRFTRMPIVYERAAGGPDTSNPVGMRVYAADTYGAMGIPNLQPPGLNLHQRGEWVPPIGYGPIAPTWPSRVEKLGQRNAAFAQAIRYDTPLPEGIDARFFNVAPEDQQTTSIRANERIVLENLHQEHSRLVTSLPGFTPRAVVERNGSAEEVTLAADTLWIDTDRGQCTLVWRGHISLAHSSELGRIVITMNEPGGASRTTPSHMSPPEHPDEIIDDEEALGSTTTLVGSMSVGSGAILPFVRNVEAPPLPGRAPGAPPAPTKASTPAFSRPLPPATPFQAPPAPPAAVHPAPPPPVPPAAPTRAPLPASPWAVAPDAVPRPATPSGAFLSPPAVTPKPPPVSVSEAARLGVASASTAAASADRADRAEPVEQPRQTQSPKTSVPAIPAAPSKEATTLLWFDEGKAKPIVENQQWVKLLSEVDAHEVKAHGDDEEEEEENYFAEEPEEEEEDEPEDVKQRRRITKIMARGEPADGPGLALAMTNAVTKNGALEPPIMLAGGDLSFPFDPWETVKALVIAAMPTAVSDKKLKEMLESVTETSKMAGIERSTSIAEALATRVRDAFMQANRQLGVAWLDMQAERILLEGRCYQKRSVLGQTFLRCLLHAPGAEEGIPTYLTESLAKTIPLLSRMRARVVAEVHAQQDQYETYPRSLRVLALARMVDLSANRVNR